jgi:hypothetical protein
VTDIPPDAALASLLDKGGRSNRRANLAMMRELCGRQYADGSHDFSLPAIGRLAEAEGILMGRVGYNTPFSLTTGRSSHGGPPMSAAPRPSPEDPGKPRIPDAH